MSHHNLQVGDDVSWNWGGGHPTGVVKEMKTSGKLDIESNGKHVHKNADLDNPAVHVETDGNDVVKRASELHRIRGGGGEDAAGETAVQEIQESREIKEPKKAGRGGRRGGKQTAETRKKQTEGGKKGGATTAGKKAAGGRKRKATAEEAVVGEKREREGVVEERTEKEGEDISMEKGEREKVEITQVTREEEKAEKEAGREAKKAKISPERAGDENIQEAGEAQQVEEGEAPKEKVVEPTGPTPTAEEHTRTDDELKELVDVSAAGAQPRAAAQAAREGIAITASAESVTGTGEEPPSQQSEKKRGGKKRGKAQ